MIQRFQRDAFSSMSSSELSALIWRVASIAAGLSTFYFSGALNIDKLAVDQLRSVLSALVGLDATLLGFMVSAGALLYAVANTRIAVNLQKSTHFQSVVNDLFVAATAFFLAILIGLAVVFLPAPPQKESTDAQFAISLATAARFFLGCSVTALSLLIPVGVAMWGLLTSIRPENPTSLDFD